MLQNVKMKPSMGFILVLCCISFVVTESFGSTDEELLACNGSSTNIAAVHNGGQCSTRMTYQIEQCSYITDESRSTLKIWPVSPLQPINIDFTFNGSHTIGGMLVKYENNTKCLKAGYITLGSGNGKHIFKRFPDPKRVVYWQLNHLECVDFQFIKNLHVELGGFTKEGISQIEEIKIFPPTISTDLQGATTACPYNAEYEAMKNADMKKTLICNNPSTRLMYDELRDILTTHPVTLAIMILGITQLLTLLTLLYCKYQTRKIRLAQTQWYMTPKTASKRIADKSWENHTYAVLPDRTESARSDSFGLPAQGAIAAYESIGGQHGARNQFF